MAKKRHTNEQELPFVALMDTMTNVVGVLAIVLVMMGISLARAASRVLSALPPATAAQISAAQAELNRLRAAQAPDREKQKALAAPVKLPATTLAALDSEMARLEAAMKDKGIRLLDVEALNRERAKREAELKEKKTATGQLLAERDRLKALLDTTPVVKAPPAKIVRIPASRPIPKDAQLERLLVTREGVYWLDDDAVKKTFLSEFKFSAVRQAAHNLVKRGKQTVVVYDHEKLARYFANRRIPVRGFDADIVYENWLDANPVLMLRPGGTPPADLSVVLSRIKRTPKAVVMFIVSGDGFEQYLAARELCDRMGVSAGWEYSSAPTFKLVLREIETTWKKPAPPAAPPPKPAVPGAPEIKPPSAKLD